MIKGKHFIKRPLKILIVLALLLFGSLEIYLANSQEYSPYGYPLYPKINYNSGYPKQLIDKGEYLTKAGDCIACHTNTRQKGTPFAGGLYIATPFGFFYTPNITPDKNTGIGNWTNDQFIKAMQKGIAPDGANYYPVFPYECFTKVTNDDLTAIFAYLKSIPPVNNVPPENDVLWPFSIRFLQWGWKLLFFEFQQKGVYQNDPTQSAMWNRGAYLVQGLGHCGECHTPRNLLGGVKKRHFLTGAFVSGYYAPDISSNGLSGSSVDDVVNVFINGQMLKGAGKVQGPMAEVNSDSLHYLSKDDLLSIAVYLKTVKSKAQQAANTGGVVTAATGKKIYQSKCAVCHDSGAAGAPKFGDATAWAPRIAQGTDILFQHAINGYNSMPPKGTCMNCSDNEVKAAVQYLINNSKGGTGTSATIKTPAAPPSTSAATIGKSVYEQTCSVCHDKGLLGAPKIGDQADWDPLMKENMDVLFKRSIYGYKNMPAKGACLNCTQADIEAAVKYMVKETYPNSNYSLW